MCCVIAAGVTGAAGCYRPVEVACGITCAGGTCPGQLACNAADQLCYAPATGACSETGDDGLPKTDCFGSGPFRVCVAPPGGPQSWTAPVQIDTDACPAALGGQLVHVGAVAVCAVVGTDIAIGDRVDVHGSRPLVVASGGAIAITGKIDVASHGGTRGPAANTACNPPGGGPPDMRGVGGAGGSFRGRGGDGAVPPVDASHPPNHALDPIAAPTQLVGGCAGGDGGDTTGVGAGSAGGSSGGALYLVARQRVELHAGGWINASGAGGEEVIADIAGGGGGGGGGGSGGMVRIDAPSIAIDGTIAANGGGGAAGASNALDGLPGGDPDPAQPALSAPGGSTPGPGGAGNDSTVGFSGMAGAVPPDGAGGGGGGGGGGHVVLIGNRTGTGAISPPP